MSLYQGIEQQESCLVIPLLWWVFGWRMAGCVLRSQEPGHLSAEQASVYQSQQKLSVNNHKGLPWFNI